MEWYKIILGVVAWVVGFWFFNKYKESQKSKYHNDSWKNSHKKKRSKNDRF